MTVNQNLVVPVVLWGNKPPSHSISSVYLYPNLETLITGSHDGQIIIWNLDAEKKILKPHILLLGHTTTVSCLNAFHWRETVILVSSTENGEICSWDIVQGNCIESNKSTWIHSNIMSYQIANTSTTYLFCNGFYPDILLIDPITLDQVFTLSSKIYPDWISAMCIFSGAKQVGDIVLGITVSGFVKFWTFTSRELKQGDVLHEHESKQIKCLNACCLVCCPFNTRTVLIVSSNCWRIYDAADFSVLSGKSCEPNSNWVSGGFLSSDQVIVWDDKGSAFLYKLPANSIGENQHFHSYGEEGQQKPYLYCVVKTEETEFGSYPPVFSFQNAQSGQYLVRGSGNGALDLWNISPISPKQLAQLQQEKFDCKPSLPPDLSTYLGCIWSQLDPPPAGIIDQLMYSDGQSLDITASIYLPLQGRLVCGRDDGSIVIVAATHSIVHKLLSNSTKDHPAHKLLLGHSGRVTCLLYPHDVHQRYEVNLLLSGGVDFSVCLWDLYGGTLIHRFCNHAGEITQLHIPPSTCNDRIKQCVCSVASDHSVALLSLKERKCIMLASRHFFSVTSVKWRPLDDFMVITCSDNSVYIWEMETGHLDRVIQGVSAEEILGACNEQSASIQTQEGGLANPAVHFFRGLRHRNLAAIRHAAQRGIQQLQHHHDDQSGPHHQQEARPHPPLLIQGLKTNTNVLDSHVLFFDVESLIVQLLSEEYSLMSPGTLENLGLTETSEYQNIIALTQSSSDPQKKIAELIGRVKDKAENVEKIIKEKDKHGLLAKVKEQAESVQQKIQAKAESVGIKQVQFENETTSRDLDLKNTSGMNGVESHLTLEIGRILLSLLHAWGVNPDLDTVCLKKLGLLRPICPISYGLLSKEGCMSLYFPTWQAPASLSTNPFETVKILDLEQKTKLFQSKGHWELSTLLTTTHLLCVVAIAKTLMEMKKASFLHADNWDLSVRENGSHIDYDEEDSSSQSQIKHGWSFLATLHCVLLPDKLSNSHVGQVQQIELLARKWQDSCLEVRMAAQTLLLAELNRMGASGRKKLVEQWAPYLPTFSEAHHGVSSSTSNSSAIQKDEIKTESSTPSEDTDFEEEEELGLRKPSKMMVLRLKQEVSLVILGVIGSEFGQNIETNKGKTHDDKRKRSLAEGFNIGNHSLARNTSNALVHYLVDPPGPCMPLHTPIRRSAIDLIGRGFTVWEPHIDVSKVLLTLLDLCCQDTQLPSMKYGLPLSPAADSARTARQALLVIAMARPAAFITCLAREVARYNSLQQSSQGLNTNLANCVLNVAKHEVLRVMEMLIDKMQTDIVELLVEVVDITLHCLDHGHLRARPLSEVFSPLNRFSMISHCQQTRRIAVGSKAGQIAVYELKAGKCQLLEAHKSAIAAVSFSPDGKYLALYAGAENKISFWQTSSGMFGLGTAQTKCVKTFTTPSVSQVVQLNPLRAAKLVWINNKVVSLMLQDGTISLMLHTSYFYNLSSVIFSRRHYDQSFTFPFFLVIEIF